MATPAMHARNRTPPTTPPAIAMRRFLISWAESKGSSLNMCSGSLVGGGSYLMPTNFFRQQRCALAPPYTRFMVLTPTRPHNIMRRSARRANSRSHRKRKRHSSGSSGSSSSHSSRRVRKRSYEEEDEPNHAVVAETKAVSFTEEEPEEQLDEYPEVTEDVSGEAPEDVRSYALASLEIKRMNSVWSDFRKAKAQIKHEAQNVLLGTMLERGCRTRKLRDVDGTDYVVRLTTRYQIGKLTDDALHSALISTFGTEEDNGSNSEDGDDVEDLNQELLIPDSVDEAIEKLYKGVQRARTTRKTVVQCAEATESVDAEDMDEDLHDVATAFVKADKSLRNTREEVKNRIKPYQEAMDRSENRIRDMLREKKSTSFDFDDGEGKRKINVSRRDNKRTKKPVAKKLTAQVIKDALRSAVVDSCGSKVRCGNMLASIRRAIKEATKPEEMPDTAEEPTMTSSLVVRVGKVKDEDN